MLCCSSLHSPEGNIRSPETRAAGSYKSSKMPSPTHLNHYKLSQPFDYKYSPSLATTQLPAGSIFLLPAQGRPQPIPQGLHYVQSWQDWTLECTVYLFPLAHLHLLFSRPKLFYEILDTLMALFILWHKTPGLLLLKAFHKTPVGVTSCSCGLWEMQSK